jgi:hypothetical protein
VPQLLDIRGCLLVTADIINHISRGELRATWEGSEAGQAKILTARKPVKVTCYRRFTLE